MSSELLKLAGEQHKALVKQAFLGALAKMTVPLFARAGKVLIRNPLKSMGAALTAYDVGSSGARMGDLTAGSRNMAQQFARNTPAAIM